MSTILELGGGPTHSDLEEEFSKIPQPEFPFDHKFFCFAPDCRKSFAKPSKLKAHEVVHFEEKPFKCSFEGCAASYYRNNHLKRHEATRHAKKGGDYACEFEGCLASFDTSNSLYYHAKRNHNEKKYSCEFCKQMFSKKYQVREHEYSHTGKMPFMCSKTGCKEEFATHANLKTHQKQHQKESPKECENSLEVPSSPHHTCTDCSMDFERWSQFVTHRKTMHSKRQCEICKKFFSRNNFKQHFETHEEARNAYCCPYDGCEKFYFRTSNLTHHIRHAHEGHTYTCEICDQHLSSKQKLLQHIKAFHENPVEKEVKPAEFPRNKLLRMFVGTSKDKNCLKLPKRSGPARGHTAKKARIDKGNYTKPATVTATTAFSSCSDYVHLETDNVIELSELKSEMTA